MAKKTKPGTVAEWAERNGFPVAYYDPPLDANKLVKALSELRDPVVDPVREWAERNGLPVAGMDWE